VSARTAVDWPCLIGGQPAACEQAREIVSPWDGEVVGRIAWASPEQMRAAVDAAHDAMHTPLTPLARQRILLRAAELVEQQGDELARVLADEGGKPLRSGRIEVARAASTLAIAAGEATRIGGEQIPLSGSTPGHGPLALTIRKPIGVVGAITPFNFPLNLVAHKLGPAIAAGCAVVLKPADKAPGVAIRLAELLAEAGLPDGWLSVVVGDPVAFADVLREDPRVRLISFTGSAPIGWSLAAGTRGKRVALELGNVTPAIVAADADVAAAAGALAAGAFAGAGQACISVQRVYVHRTVHDAFLDALLARVRALRLGDPHAEETEIGPLITPQATSRLLAWIGAARAAGARVAAGGGVQGSVMEPTVLLDVPADADVACREAFGPVVCVWPYDELDDAIAAANASEQGLQAGLFTSDVGTIMHAAAALDFAGVVVNDSPSWRADEMPYGGIKDSGNTREGPARAVREMTEECLLVLNP
jgi:acyl-CoA reductase-like NAD-dependent aldehyde dehydrogenase